jgi:hypothetical protein
MTHTQPESPLGMLRQQRSHVIFVLSHPRVGKEAIFLKWYQGAYRQRLLDTGGVLSVRHYQRHEVDITQGKYPLLPLAYLGLIEISIDGAEQAERLIQKITELHQGERTAEAPATWLYYPSSDKVGRAPTQMPCMLTLAFANGTPGQEAEFREWYATRHIRHALNVPALVSGQCFERTLFQRPGALEAQYATIAIYEQEGPPEAILEAFASLPKETFHFPMLDGSRFAESVYRPV